MNNKIKENNKLIAEFMGLSEPFDLPQFGTIRPNGEFKTEFTSSQLKYHSSWDWLMPVVGKINGIVIKGRPFTYFPKIVIFSDFVVLDKRGNANKTILDCEVFDIDECVQDNGKYYGDTILEATYKAVLDFIKSYNKYFKGE